MAEASARAHRGRGATRTLPNALFVASGVEALPADLDGISDRVTVTFPWGSLLRGALGLDRAVAGSIARLVGPHGTLEITVSVTERDGIPEITGGGFGPADLERLTEVFATSGLRCRDARRLTDAEIRATDSSWARRLRTDAHRPVWQVRLERIAERPVDHADRSTA